MDVCTEVAALAAVLPNLTSSTKCEQSVYHQQKQWFLADIRAVAFIETITS
jgi:hypothetical protein